jgi:hypothetical protein
MAEDTASAEAGRASGAGTGARALLCPACGREAPRGPGPGDLAACQACGARFWALDGEDRGRPVRAPERPPLSGAAVAAFHAGVLAAELVLALAVLGLFIGLPLFAVVRLAGR